MKLNKFVIFCRAGVDKLTDTKDLEFLGYDSNSGGYSYWSSFLSSARLFNTLEDAEKELNSSDFKRISKTTDGNVFPPRMIHSGLKINYANKEATGVIGIAEIELKVVKQDIVGGKIEYRKE